MPRPGHNDLPAPDNTFIRYDRHGNVQHWPDYGQDRTPPVEISDAERKRRINFRIFILRCIQTLIATIYLPFLLFSVTHKGWWTGIQRPMGLGRKLLSISHRPVAVVKLNIPKLVGATAATYLTSFYYQMASCSHTDRWFYRWWPACLIDLGNMILWITTTVYMCGSKGKDYRHLFDEPPYFPWGFAAGLAGIQGYYPPPPLFYQVF